MNESLLQKFQNLSRSIPAEDEPLQHPIGRFRISIQFVRYSWESLLPLLSQMVVVECRTNYDTDTFDYLALSHLFGMWPKYEPAPEYKIITSRTETDAGFDYQFTAERIV